MENRATQSLLFLLSVLDKWWFHPIAKFLTSHLGGGGEVGPLVSQALEKTHASGISIRGIVFDGDVVGATYGNYASKEFP